MFDRDVSNIVLFSWKSGKVENITRYVKSIYTLYMYEVVYELCIKSPCICIISCEVVRNDRGLRWGAEDVVELTSFFHIRRNISLRTTPFFSP